MGHPEQKLLQDRGDTAATRPYAQPRSPRHGRDDVRGRARHVVPVRDFAVTGWANICRAYSAYSVQEGLRVHAMKEGDSSVKRRD
jgi:hypothetical protein